MNRWWQGLVGTSCAVLVYSMLGATLSAGFAGCKKQEAEAPPPPKPVETKPPEPPPPAPKPMTQEELATWYQDCWSKFNAKDFDNFKKCFAADADSTMVDAPMPPAQGQDAVIASAQMFTKGFPDATGEAQLILVNGKTVTGVWLIKGKNTGEFGPPDHAMPATGKNIGMLMGHVVEANDANTVQHEKLYMDHGTMMAQLGVSPMPARAVMDKGAAAPTVVIAKDDETEKKNIETEKAMEAAWNKHDIKATSAFFADDVKWSEIATPGDQDKKTLSKGLEGMWKAFSDVKVTSDNVWAAGDYVVLTGLFEGTNDGDMPAMKLKKTGKKVKSGYLRIDRLEGGKVKEAWLFYDGMAFASQLGLIPEHDDKKAGEKGAEKGAAPAEKGAEMKEKEAPKGEAAPATPPK